MRIVDRLTGWRAPFRLMGLPMMPLPGEHNSHWAKSGSSYLVGLEAKAGSDLTLEAGLITHVHALDNTAHAPRIEHAVISVLGTQGGVLGSDWWLVL